MKTFKVLLIMFVLFIGMFLNGSALAIPSADFSYVETDLGSGMWQYDYTFINTSDTVADAGFDLYDVLLYFDPLKSLMTNPSVPNGWGWIDGAGFVEVYSLNPGEPPFGTDIAPGSSLSDFVFQFDYRAGALPFDVTLWNPDDPDNPKVYSSAVPEPTIFLLMCAGIVGIGLVRRFKN
jgi:hypothetical protein